MQIPRDHIIIGLITLTLVFLLAGGFLVVYVALYNSRKRRHFQEKELMQKSFEQELLTSQLEVQEQTLKTIAREIHDNVGQILSLAKLTLGSIHVFDAPEKADQKVKDCFVLVDSSIKELRGLTNILYAENLLAEGLEKAVENELKWLGKTDRYNIKITTTGLSSNKIHGTKQLIAFRLVQEVLNNIIKHSKASEIKVAMEYAPEGLHLQIRDNGIGFDVPLAIEKNKGMGLGNFYKRAQMIGGSFQLESMPGEGTTAILQIPYEKHE